MRRQAPYAPRAGTPRNLKRNEVSAAVVEGSGILPLPEQHADNRIARCEIESSLGQAPPCAPLLLRRVIAPFSPAVRYEKLPRPENLPPVQLSNRRRQVRVLQYRDGSFGLCIGLPIEADRRLVGRHYYWPLAVRSGDKVLPSDAPGEEFTSAREAPDHRDGLVTSRPKGGRACRT